METFASTTMVLLHLELAVAKSASAEPTFRLLFFPKGKAGTSQYPELKETCEIATQGGQRSMMCAWRGNLTLAT